MACAAGVKQSQHITAKRKSRMRSMLGAPFTAASLPGFPGLLNALLAGMAAPVRLLQVRNRQVQVTLRRRQ